MSASAKEFGEFYESIEGVAIKDMSCDGGCGTGGAGIIKTGDKCYAGVLLPSMFHPNYSSQRPEVWSHDFLTPKQ